MFPTCLKLLVSWFLFLSAESHSGDILPPRNLSLVWKDDIYPVLTWEPPEHASDCTYKVQSQTKEKHSTKRSGPVTSPWTVFIVMQGGFLELTLTALCNNSESKDVLIHSDQDIVKELNCSVISSSRTECLWKTAHPITDLGFFYRLAKEDHSRSVTDNSSSPLQECPSYIYDGDNKTGCTLEATIQHSIQILLNGTKDDKLIRNTFKKINNQMKLSPLNWTVTKVGGKFNISWVVPEIKLQWEYVINYTECNKSKLAEVRTPETSYELVFVPHCNYVLQIQAKYQDHSTRWSDKIFFDADILNPNPNAVVWAAIIIPLVFAGLAILTFVCCRKNKDHIFPKVPQPRDFLSDIYDNNNKSTIRDLYIPAEEEENCKIILVIDSQNEYKPDY